MTKSNGSARAAAKKSSSKPERKVLMVRLDEPLKRKLQQHSAARSKKEGRNVSYNEVVTGLIRAMPGT